MRRSLEVEKQQDKLKEFTEEQIHAIYAESHSMFNKIAPSIRRERLEDEDTTNEEYEAQSQDLIERDKYGKRLYELKGNSFPKKVQQICLKTGITPHQIYISCILYFTFHFVSFNQVRC